MIKISYCEEFSWTTIAVSSLDTLGRIMSSDFCFFVNPNTWEITCMIKRKPNLFNYKSIHVNEIRKYRLS